MTEAYLAHEEILAPVTPRLLRHACLGRINGCHWPKRRSGRNANAHRSMFAGHRRRACRACMDLVSLHGKRATGQDHPEAGQPRTTAGQTLYHSAYFPLKNLRRWTVRFPERMDGPLLGWPAAPTVWRPAHRCCCPCWLGLSEGAVKVAGHRPRKRFGAAPGELSPTCNNRDTEPSQRSP